MKNKSRIPVYPPNEFDDQPLHCSRCGWKGEGSETNLIDFYGVTDYQEAHCPNCDTPLARVTLGDGRTGESPGPIGFQTG